MTGLLSPPTKVEIVTLGGEPCGAEWHAIQNLCDINGLELRECKYTVKGTTGYIVKNTKSRASIWMRYEDRLEDWLDAVKGFMESNGG